jgi:plastocyanin
MRSLRPAVIVGLAVLVALALAACTSAAAEWTYAPAPPATPTPVASSDASAVASTPPSAGVSPSAGGAIVQLEAQNIQYNKATIGASAGIPFQIFFKNNDAGIPHNVAIKDASGTIVFAGDVFNGVAERTYQVPALPPGNYTFFCQVHANMVGTLVVAP